MVRVLASRDQFIKTKMCPHLASGGCRKGPTCNYAHRESELRGMPNLQKTRLCDIWQMQGSCPKGASCHFAHGEKELRFTSAYFKTDLCKYWKSGFCSAGDECRHAHGIPELRPRKFNEGEIHMMQEGLSYSILAAGKQHPRTLTAGHLSHTCVGRRGSSLVTAERISASRRQPLQQCEAISPTNSSSKISSDDDDQEIATLCSSISERVDQTCCCPNDNSKMCMLPNSDSNKKNIEYAAPEETTLASSMSATERSTTMCSNIPDTFMSSSCEVSLAVSLPSTPTGNGKKYLDFPQPPPLGASQSLHYPALHPSFPSQFFPQSTHITSSASIPSDDKYNCNYKAIFETCTQAQPPSNIFAGALSNHCLIQPFNSFNFWNALRSVPGELLINSQPLYYDD